MGTGLRPTVSPLLEWAAALSWRVLAVAAGLGLLGWVAVKLSLVLLPLAAALLLSALLLPLATFLRRRGAGRALSTWAALVFFLVVIAGAVWFVVVRVLAQLPDLVEQFGAVVRSGYSWLERRPLDLQGGELERLRDRILDWISSHRASVLQRVLSTTATVLELLAAVLLMLFSTYFFLAQGERIWRWFTSLFSPAISRRVDAAGRSAWMTLKGWIRGTVLIALFHGTVIAIALLLLRVPLVAPLSMLVFLGGFVPYVGAFIGGGAAVLVALSAKGLIGGLVLLIVLVAENQMEGHLLQPFVVGHYVRLHPLGLAVTLGAGAVLGGIAGAIIAVPLVASLRQAFHGFRGPGGS
jgi:predicted PurR-regulated permease PerM